LKTHIVILAAFHGLVGGIVAGTWYNPPPRRVPQARPPVHSTPTSEQQCLPVDNEDPRVTSFRLTQHGLWDGLILDSSLNWGLDPWVVSSLLWVESKMKPTAENMTSGALGLAQLTPGGRRAVENLRAKRGIVAPFTRLRALEPRDAIPAAAELLAYMIDRCGGLERGLRGYNTGSCGVPSGYVRDVMARSKAMVEEAAPRRCEP
jgi:hypothetical protein